MEKYFNSCTLSILDFSKTLLGFEFNAFKNASFKMNFTQILGLAGCRFQVFRYYLSIREIVCRSLEGMTEIDC